MIAGITIALQDFITDFLTANYTSGTDVSSTSPVYALPEFDPQDVDTFDRIKIANDYSFVIYDVAYVNDDLHPNSHLKIRCSCSIAVVYRSGNQYDLTNRAYRPIIGSASAPLANSMSALVGDLAKYARSNGTNKGGVESYWQDITRVEPPIIIKGKYIVIVCRLEALFMESKTIDPHVV